VNKSTREIIEREIGKLDAAIAEGETEHAGAQVRLARIKADLAAARARRAELQHDLDGQRVVINVNTMNVSGDQGVKDSIRRQQAQAHSPIAGL
jgi:chromosome segregation ATPase